MKNAIRYYYNMTIGEIRNINGIYHFTYENRNYVLAPVEQEEEKLKQLYELQMKLYQRGIYVHQILLNNSRAIVTNINGMNYIVMLLLYEKQKISLKDILYFNNHTVFLEENKVLKRDNWGRLWAEKIDYFEYQISQFGKKFPLIRSSFSYVVGIAETGIQFYQTLPQKKRFCLTHQRIHVTDTTFELYNPLNFVLDARVRDASEFFKNDFFYGKDNLDEVKEYLYSERLTVEECLLFFSRMFFLTPYFDLYEEIVDGKKEEEQIKKIINRLNDYEKYLKELYHYLRTYMNIEEIEWLFK